MFQLTLFTTPPAVSYEWMGCLMFCPHMSGLTCYTEVNLNFWLIVLNGMNLSVWLCKTEHSDTKVMGFDLWQMAQHLCFRVLLEFHTYHHCAIPVYPICLLWNWMILFFMKPNLSSVHFWASLWQKSSTVKYIKKYSCFFKSTFFRKSSLFPNKEHPWGKVRRRTGGD